MPNGRSLDDDHYQYKLRWLAQLRRHVAATEFTRRAVIVAGDFNIAPADIDVYDPAKFVGATHTSPPERALLAELCDWGMIDLFRQHHSDAKLYSWWDYRAGDFHQGRGLRIDLVLGTQRGRRTVHVERDRPQRPQGTDAVGSRTRHRRARLTVVIDRLG